MASKLAHELSEDIWRSDDVSINAYCNKASHHVEIITPEQRWSKNEPQSTNVDSDGSSNYLLQSESSTFSSIKIDPRIVDDLKRCGFVRPSPIQASALPLGRIGIDLIAQSKSGTGKTIVFVVCALELVLRSLDQPAAVRVLIVTPTREIAVQIGDIINSLTCKWANFACYIAIGGTKVSTNLEQLSKSQIVVGTPGRICCLLEMAFLKPSAIRLLVLDECDKLMEESFRMQIDKLYGYLPENKQMIVTSATLSDSMTLFLANYMRTPALVRLNADNPALIGVMQLYHLTKGHSLDYLNFESKIEPLLEILQTISFSQCVIFCNYQTRAKYLFDRLVTAKWKVMQINGDMTQSERLETINAFRRHRFRILVSTDLTSRGIDIDSVNLIINLDVPIDSETYLHRVGRAGRFGSAGIAITLVGQGSDFDKFMNIVNEYKLDVKSLTLPITRNLWNFFYKDRLERNRLSLLECWKEAPKINAQFECIVNMFQPRDEQGEGKQTTTIKEEEEEEEEKGERRFKKEDCYKFQFFNKTDKVYRLDGSNTNDAVERNFLFNLLNPPSTCGQLDYEVSLNVEKDDQITARLCTTEDEITQSNTDNNSSSLVISDDNSDKDDGLIVDEASANESPQTIASNALISSTPPAVFPPRDTFSDSIASPEANLAISLFKQTFFRPHSFISASHCNDRLAHTAHSLAMYKYLINGGSKQ